MKNFLTSTGTVVALLTTGGVCAEAAAQSLGTPSVEVLMGRPLQMDVPARFATAGDAEECVHADVFYGETRVATTRVRATVSGPPEQRRIRVESNAPIDEPVVTVSIRVGCHNTITRNYTLLPEFPSERAMAVADARTAMADATPVVPLRASTAAARSPRRVTAAVGAGTSPHASVLAQGEAHAKPVTAARHGHKGRVHSEAPARSPRLSLEAIELPPTDSLRVSTSLAEPEGDAARRAAAALLWQAINAGPQELLRTGAMLQKLEQDLAALREDAARSRQEIAALRQRLDPGRPWYASDLLVKLLALLVLAAAAIAGVLGYRARQARRWEEAWYELAESNDASLEEGERVVGEVGPRFASARISTPAPGTETPRRADAAKATIAAPIEDRPPAAQAGFDGVETPPRRPGPGQRKAEAALRVETLAATFAEVEFLQSLGLTQDAMDRLKAYLQDSDQPAPLAYLELMRLSEEAGDSAAVAAVRRRYASTFRVEAPRLPQISADTGVDAMPELCARLTRAWGSPDALATLEQALSSVPTPAVPMSVRAGRELLLLHALATQGTGAATGAADTHPVAPWADAQDAHDAQATLAQAAQVQGGGRFGLDVDLSEQASDAWEVSTPVPPELQRVPAPQPVQVVSQRELERRRQEEAAEAFSAAVAAERVPVSRY
ncbi:hypothetical protein JJB11_25340 [Ramlibacter ginsenosidimutans]|uniref:Uncharacterized protein n=1 Tax=Ramlibacter ginsenosidimutans TaxID=502333 RepID=A0A934TYI3_9BURK|nr:hypothetical protein [Ramlibacter ginsenosidimutans]MBK6009436.1 hypothetical protein [Ramlibacter ginsenosidimutans]